MKKIICGTLVLILTACSAHQLETEEMIVHRVAYQGENPSMIAKWYTGEAANWPEISTYNGHIRPKSLQPSAIVRIPVGMVTAKTKMPASYVTKELATYPKITRKQPMQKVLPQTVKPQPSEELSEAEVIEDSLLEKLVP